MKHILLVCNAGMSTSMLVKKMQNEAKASNIEVSIEAKPLAEAKKDLANYDCILLGPQIRYELKNVKGMAGDLPVDVINMQDYGMMNGKKVLKTALKMMGE
jgi:PTS system cellobiose-specific IIB component